MIPHSSFAGDPAPTHKAIRDLVHPFASIVHNPRFVGAYEKMGESEEPTTAMSSRHAGSSDRPCRSTAYVYADLHVYVHVGVYVDVNVHANVNAKYCTVMRVCVCIA